MNKYLGSLIVLLVAARCQPIVDYSHTEYLQKSNNNQNKNFDINIHPQRQKSDYLQFSESCKLSDKLSLGQVTQQFQNALIEEQKSLQNLKNNMTYFLKLTQLIKEKKSFLTRFQLSQLQEDNELTLPISDYFQDLYDEENQLKRKNQEIQKKITYVNLLISQELNKTNQDSFDQISLNFMKNIYQSRLNYLIKLKDSMRENPGKDGQKQISNFFQDLEQSAAQEKREYNAIIELMTKFSTSNELKLRISNIQNQIQALNLMIYQKQSCDEQKNQYLRRENKQQIEKIYSELKELKKKESPNRQFCEGVASSLVRQLKKLLNVYNYSFTCSEGLSDLKGRRLILKVQLQRLNRQYGQIDYDGRSGNIKNFFKNQEALRQRFMDDILKFKLTDYALNLKTVEQEIQNTQNKLKDITYKLQNPPQNSNKTVDFTTIRQIISQIEHQQHKYCQVKDKYQAKYREFDIILRAFQHKSFQKIQKHLKYISLVNELRQLQVQFQKVRSGLIKVLT